jgi:hypothetical protein
MLKRRRLRVIKMRNKNKIHLAFLKVKPFMSLLHEAEDYNTVLSLNDKPSGDAAFYNV